MLLAGAASVAFFVVRRGRCLGFSSIIDFVSSAGSVVVEGVSVVFFVALRGRRCGFSSVATSATGTASALSETFSTTFFGARRGLRFGFSSLTASATGLVPIALGDPLSSVFISGVVSAEFTEVSAVFFVALRGRRFGFSATGAAVKSVSDFVTVVSGITCSSALATSACPCSGTTSPSAELLSAVPTGLFLLLLLGRGLGFSATGSAVFCRLFSSDFDSGV